MTPTWTYDITTLSRRLPCFYSIAERNTNMCRMCNRQQLVGFPTCWSSSILRRRPSASTFCRPFLTCSSEIVCFCWVQWSWTSCSDDRAEWSLSSKDDTCSCCSGEAKVEVRVMGSKPTVATAVRYIEWTFHNDLFPTPFSVSVLFVWKSRWAHLLQTYLSSHFSQFLLCLGPLGHACCFCFTQILWEMDIVRGHDTHCSAQRPLLGHRATVPRSQVKYNLFKLYPLAFQFEDAFL